MENNKPSDQDYSESQSTPYCLTRRYGSVTFSEALGQVKDSLRKAEFDIISEMDITEYLKDQFQNLPKHLILLICNKKTAAELISNDIQMTTLIPCKISLKEIQNDNSIEIAIEDTEKTWSLSEKSDVKNMATEVKKLLTKLLDYIGPKHMKL